MVEYNAPYVPYYIVIAVDRNKWKPAGEELMIQTLLNYM